ncbi:MAG: peptidoglycan DD-metalloendopeptidase family protein [Flavobacteriaceae bacterium]|nr:peptidoglycan DD-metalloendopeptidase family protein [Flavobacteriaceae bacterium]
MKQLLATCILTATVVLSSCNPKEEIVEDIALATPEKKNIVFGIDANQYKLKRDTVSSGDTFGVIMDRYKIPPAKVHQIVEATKPVYDFTKIKAGKPYSVFIGKDSIDEAHYFVYEPSVERYILLKIKDSICIEEIKHPLSIKERTASGVITTNLSEAMDAEGINFNVIYEMADIYRWSIDFFKLQKNDKFKLIFRERYINDSIFAGLEAIDAAVFQHQGKDYYAFNYTYDSIRNLTDYYDEKGNTLRNFFLRAPVTYSRISSRFSPRRFHPVQKRWKAHKGTDYAAPHGTPILSTANGVVIKSGYTSGNGNYVKIRHNSTYETQYLHMSKRLVKVGQRVKQGDVIGLVGSTGLATGPHVCYRFWVNGVQKDPYREKLPAGEPLKEEILPKYLDYIADLKQHIDQIPFKDESAEEVQQEDEPLFGEFEESAS